MPVSSVRAPSARDGISTRAPESRLRVAALLTFPVMTPASAPDAAEIPNPSTTATREKRERRPRGVMTGWLGMVG